MAYAVITHCRLVSEKLSFVWIVGSATLTIDTSRTVMKKAAPTSASAVHRLGSSSTWLIAVPPRGAWTWSSVPHSKLPCRLLLDGFEPLQVGRSWAPSDPPSAFRVHRSFRARANPIDST